MFDYGKPVRGDKFFDRTKAKKELESFIGNGTDFMIKAPRRYGKTSLILEVLKEKKFIYLDIRRLPRLSMLSEIILNEAYKQAGISGFVQKAKKNAVSLLKEGKVSFKVDLSILELGAEFYADNTDKINPCEELQLALESVDRIARGLGREFIVVFDEFQDIKRFNCDGIDITEILRGTLQHMGSIHAIFLGSIESIMTNIFESKKSPFYNFCRKVTLGPFDIQEVHKDLIAAFSSRKIYFEEDKDLKETLDRLKGHPANTMLVMQNIYYHTLEKKNKLVKKRVLDIAYEKAYEEQMDLVEQYIIELNTRKNHHDVIYRTAIGAKQALGGAALYQVRSSLVDKGYMHKNNKDEYVIIDNFLEEYLKRTEIS
ncbi:MAG: ATP-binding protein [Campylobacterota bacterium]|nr:ATP-binding protein [Campylobacterota bacterium]